MAYSFAQLRDIESRIVRDLADVHARLDSAVGAFTAAETALTGLQSSYATWATEVNAFLTANPDDDAVKTLKASRDRLVAEFVSAKTRAGNLKTAVSGI